MTRRQARCYDGGMTRKPTDAEFRREAIGFLQDLELQIDQHLDGRDMTDLTPDGDLLVEIHTQINDWFERRGVVATSFPDAFATDAQQVVVPAYIPADVAASVEGQRRLRLGEQMVWCPYPGCGLQGTENEIDDHRIAAHSNEPQAGSNRWGQP